jgi:hypothetical protein
VSYSGFLVWLIESEKMLPRFDRTVVDRSEIRVVMGLLLQRRFCEGGEGRARGVAREYEDAFLSQGFACSCEIHKTAWAYPSPKQSELSDNYSMNWLIICYSNTEINVTGKLQYMS